MCPSSFYILNIIQIQLNVSDGRKNREELRRFSNKSFLLTIVIHVKITILTRFFTRSFICRILLGIFYG